VRVVVVGGVRAGRARDLHTQAVGGLLHSAAPGP
jgi:hypothetical protein